MTDTLQRVLTHRVTTLAAATAALVMAVLLAISWSTWTAQRTALERRITALSAQSERSKSLWQAQLSACQAGAGGPLTTEAAYEASGQPHGDRSAATQRLLDEQPEGIDVCARMESADQAVLSTLKK